ncbi:MAG: aspartate--tRNA ligase [Planctomycetota bacterium]
MARAPWQRTHRIGALSEAQIGQKVVLNGWVAKRRNMGGIYFLDIRDRFGLAQVLLTGTEERIGWSMAEGEILSPEDVLSVTGTVRRREQPNPDLPTGQIEVLAERVEVLSRSPLPPFEIERNSEANVELRLRYRYLDLRRPDMQEKLAFRSRFIGAMRNAFLQRDFLEVETPILTRATPEGARDYLVPSRVHAGSFYALPQSPQIFKQILMVAGMDRYFQVARCFRDEDLRADRQPEFTQLDMEMSFAEEEDIYETWEGVLRDTFRDAMEVELPEHFPRLTWHEAMTRYGVDKPDTRFGLELQDVGEWAASCGFGVFEAAIAGGDSVQLLCLEGGAESYSRGAMKNLEKHARDHGAKGLAWWKPGEEGGAAGPVAKFLEGEVGERLLAQVGGKSGDLLLFAAGPRPSCWRVLGELRVRIGRELGLASAGQWNFLWVTEFPMFEWDEETQRYYSAHHPFTAPQDWNLSGDLNGMPSRSYDLVLNGWELGSGSVRIHRQDVQQKVFHLLGISKEEQQLKFAFLLEALSYGAPPHAGFAIGLDRLVALSLGMDSIRDVVAFPKTLQAVDLMCQAPSPVESQLLTDVHIQLRQEP